MRLTERNKIIYARDCVILFTLKAVKQKIYTFIRFNVFLSIWKNTKSDVAGTTERQRRQQTKKHQKRNRNAYRNKTA